MDLEAERIQCIIDVNDHLTKTADGVRLRAQHAKHHGCVDAIFTVHDGLPPEYCRGVFAKPVSYRAKVRFSNGGGADDSQADVHGMAIKLLDVPGKPLLPGHEAEGVQDFILIDKEVFFEGDLGVYTWFNKMVGARQPGTWGKLKFLANVAMADPGLALRLLGFVTQKPGSPLTCRYFSTTPYKLGDLAVKYVAQPKQKGPDGVTGPDGLFQALQTGLATQDAVFSFGVHVQRDPRAQPIEDPSVSWSNGHSADQVLATLTIPKQPVDKSANQAQALIFNPWHASAEHEPLGAINRARGEVYDVLSKRRHGTCVVQR